MKLRIVNSSGKGTSTQVFNAETGEEISLRRVRSIQIIIDSKGPTRALFEFSDVQVDFVSDVPVNFTGL